MAKGKKRQGVLNGKTVLDTTGCTYKIISLGREGLLPNNKDRKEEIWEKSFILQGLRS